ncbi:MAG: phosphatase PAP2 family protein [Bacteroidales bacterium]|nr:phosphatase PAP2 family protein [Bacteroidales bacterium]
MIKKYRILLLFSIIPLSIFSQNIDIQILRSHNSQNIQSSDDFFRFASNTNTGIVLGVPVTMGIAGLIKHDNKLFRNACVVAVASGINMGFTNALKYSINRKRPFETYPDIMKKSDVKDPSFPSGHTSSAFATATSLSLAYPKWYIIAPSYLWAGTVGYSRMHLGVHYPSDVLGGMIAGSGSAYLTYKANKWLNNCNWKRHGHQ